MTIFGWDMSHYDVPALGNAMSEGIAFVTHKAGGDSDDNEIGAWWNGVKDIPDPYWDDASQSWKGLLKGAYWVLYPGNPVVRADAFIARLDATCPGWRDRPFMLQGDCEIWNNDPNTQPGLSDISRFCDRLVQRMPKLRPIDYASRGQYRDRLKGLKYPLWNANYPSSASGTVKNLYAHVGGDQGVGWFAYSGQTPPIWQFSSNAIIGGQTTSDANAFRGDLGELVKLVAPGWSDDVSEADVTAALKKFFVAGPAQPDGTPDSLVGKLVLNQGIPNGLRPADPAHGMTHERSMAWVAIEELGVAVASLAARPQATVDPVDLKEAVKEALLEIFARPTP